MPEQVNNIENTLLLLEDKTVCNYLLRCKCYNEAEKILSTNLPIDKAIIERIMAVCIHDMRKDLKYTAISLSVLTSVLKRVEEGQCSPEPDLTICAQELLLVLNTTGNINNIESIHTMCLDIFWSLPDDTLKTLALSNCKDLVNFFGIYENDTENHGILFQKQISILHKLLKILGKTEKQHFIEEAVSVLFSTIFPKLLENIFTLIFEKDESLVILELLTDELYQVDYSMNCKWLIFLENIYTPLRYPASTKKMLEGGSDCWYRVWNMFIKLLKNQITSIQNNKIGSPINSLLTVVEKAFKMDLTNRCRAFDCWKVLIDNFSSEINENVLDKRIKLLVIPLISNNAKVNETAFAKLNTWWHLIQSYQSKLDKLAKIVLMPLLNFCFGKLNTGCPSFMSKDTIKLSVAMLIEVLGHTSCLDCTRLGLKNKALNTKLLVDYWNEWVYFIKLAISLVCSGTIDVTSQQIKCGWKSFVITICELPNNNIRKDLFGEVLNIIMETTKVDGVKAFCVTALSLFEDENICKIFFTNTDDLINRFYKICDCALSLLQSPNDHECWVVQLKPMMTFAVMGSTKSIGLIDNHLLAKLEPINNHLIAWTTLAEATSSTNWGKKDYNILSKLMCWPLKNLDKFSNMKILKVASETWYTFNLNSKLNQEQFFKILNNEAIKNNSSETIYFKLHVLLSMIKNTLTCDCFKTSDFEISVKLLHKYLSTIISYKNNHLEELYPKLIDTLTLILNRLTEYEDKDVALNVFNSVNIVLQCFVNEATSKSSEVINYIIFLENLIESLKSLFKCRSYLSLKNIIANNLIKILKSYGNNKSLVNKVLLTLNIILSKSMESETVYKNITAAIKSYELMKTQENISSIVEEDLNKNKFTTPDSKVVKKVKKTNEPCIVKNVTVDGEDYVVVNSNWKFNARKLTENQKEKFKMKRDDIPALYQDLSQSQDEFKINSESQDISTSTSMSNGKLDKNNQSASTILKDTPCIDMVPRIMENILSENNLGNEDAMQKTKLIPKDAKSPRIALKDRVFQNMKNLIEKSSINKDENDTEISLPNKSNGPVTPKNKLGLPLTVFNSAPSKLNAERPLRAKRKPKKFDNAELFGLKKRRHSLNQHDLDNNELVSNLDSVCDNKKNNININQNIVTEIEKKKLPMSATESSDDLENNLITNHEDEKKVIPLDKIDTELEHLINKPDLDLSEKKSPNIEIFDSKNIPIEQTSQGDTMDIIIDNNKDTFKFKESVVPLPKMESPEKLTMKASFNNKDKCKELVVPLPILETPEKSTKKTLVNPMDIIIDNNKDTFKLKELVVPLPIMESTNKTPVNNKDTYKLKELIVPLPIIETPESSTKKTTAKKPIKNSRIIKELQIDMVEGHPFLKVPQSEKRITRKCISTSEKINRRKSLSDKFSRSNSDPITTLKSEKKFKTNSKMFEQESKTEEQQLSEDVIESSQDSTITIMSTKSNKDHSKKVNSEKMQTNVENELLDTQNLLHSDSPSTLPSSLRAKEDIDLPFNKTDTAYNIQIDLTESMDTEPVDEVIKNSETEINTINSPIIVNTDDISMDSQKTAEDETQPVSLETTENDIYEINHNSDITCDKSRFNTTSTHQDLTTTIAQTDVQQDESSTSGILSPSNDRDQRKKDFLNNTLEISPIKTMSPERNQKSPTPENSNDYIVVTLKSPVQYNGEPYEKCQSPEIFTEDKTSPDKRDQSPPRDESNVVANSSPTSSLSLKKNRTQVRPSGRGAQMLGLCVQPDRLQSFVNSDKSEIEEVKKSSMTTPARRNLRILYSSVGDNKNDQSDENEETDENFLRFKKLLPTANSSPVGPILKRKLIDIADDTTVSPASKRKRVSFHDPPVSTTMCVQKYIEPMGIRSPQNSVQKRLERQLRSQANPKSQRKLDSVFKLDNVLSKAVESFTDVESAIDDTLSSLEQTPAAEVIDTTELNDSDPICPDLVGCLDPIDEIAVELSSLTMKSLLVRELQGKVETIGDLAKMTELEVNRLCIKAPKIIVAKKVLCEYLSKKNNTQLQNMETLDDTICPTIDEVVSVDTLTETEEQILNKLEVSIQTDGYESCDNASQTTQSSSNTTFTQTNETGFLSTSDLIKSCIQDRKDFNEILLQELDENSKKSIADNLPVELLSRILANKMIKDDFNPILNEMLEKHENHKNSASKILQEYLCQRFDNKDLIQFCIQLLETVHKR